MLFIVEPFWYHLLIMISCSSCACAVWWDVHAVITVGCPRSDHGDVTQIVAGTATSAIICATTL